MKLCGKCGTWHICSPIPKQCACGAALSKYGTVQPPTGDAVSGAPIEIDGAGLGRNSIYGAVRTRPHEVL